MCVSMFYTSFVSISTQCPTDRITLKNIAPNDIEDDNDFIMDGWIDEFFNDLIETTPPFFS